MFSLAVGKLSLSRFPGYRLKADDAERDVESPQLAAMVKLGHKWCASLAQPMQSYCRIPDGTQKMMADEVRAGVPLTRADRSVHNCMENPVG